MPVIDRYALTGKIIQGELDLVAADSVDIEMGQGGGFRKGAYAPSYTLLAGETATVAADGVANDETYSVTLRGKTVSYTADASATATEIRDGLQAAIQAVWSDLTVTDNSTDAIDIVAPAGEGLGDVSVSATGSGTLALTGPTPVAPPASSIVDLQDGKFRIGFASAFTGKLVVSVSG